jgi:UDP-N-acetyl-2-amino-2-deoxyglucuronate dehydrogenase
MNGSREFKVVIIGCGRIAGHHCRSIAATDGITLAAVCDLAVSKAADYGREFSVPHYTNYHDMLSRHPEAEIVVVATPSGMHAEHALDVIERYKRHVIVEKPTFLRPGQLLEVYAAAARNGRRIYPIYQNRYNKAVQRVKQALGSGELGDVRIVNVRVRWCRPQRYYDMAEWRGTMSHDGGALTNQSIHHVDLLRHLGGEIDRVHAVMRTLGANIEAEDTVVAVFTYANGAVGSLEATTAARPDDFEASISLVGSKGLAQIGGIAVNELQVFTPDPSACIAHSENFASIEGYGAVYGFGHAGTYADIAHDLRGNVPYPISEADALATLRLLHAFYRSGEIDGWVRVADAAESVHLGRVNDAISTLYRTAASEPAETHGSTR